MKTPILILVAALAACVEKPAPVGYTGPMISVELREDLRTLIGRPLSESALGSQPFKGWEHFEHSGFYVGSRGPAAVMRQPGGDLIELPVRCEADARAYMRLFGVESIREGETSPEFDAALRQLKPAADRR